MIGYLKGIVKTVSGTGMLIDVNSVGYEVSIIGHSVLVDDEVALFIYTYVREDRIQLYGFEDEKAIKLFRLLISVKGVGPKVGQALIVGLQNDILLSAILNRDTDIISSVPGIGKKGAERLILELRTKVEEMGVVSGGIGGKAIDLLINTKQKEAIEALEALGYKKNEAKKKVAQVSENDRELSTEEIIKKSLSI